MAMMPCNQSRHRYIVIRDTVNGLQSSYAHRNIIGYLVPTFSCSCYDTVALRCQYRYMRMHCSSILTMERQINKPPSLFYDSVFITTERKRKKKNFSFSSPIFLNIPYRYYLHLSISPLIESGIIKCFCSKNRRTLCLRLINIGNYNVEQNIELVSHELQLSRI